MAWRKSSVTIPDFQAASSSERKKFWTRIAINFAKVLGVLGTLVVLRFIMRGHRGGSDQKVTQRTVRHTKTRKLTGAVLLWLWMSAGAGATTTTPSSLEQVPSFTVTRMSEPPTIDGVIDAVEWQEALAPEGFDLRVAISGPAAIELAGERFPILFCSTS